MKNLQKAGGIAALTAAGTYLFAMGLVVSLLGPMADPDLGFPEYMAFLEAHKTLVFLWHSVMYFVNGICLAVLVPALYERLKPASPRLALVASIFGLLWTAFVFLSGVITNHGTEALLALHGINNATLLEWSLRPGGCLDAARQLQREGRCRWVGFSTHATTDVILRAVESDRFDYVNLDRKSVV